MAVMLSAGLLGARCSSYLCIVRDPPGGPIMNTEFKMPQPIEHYVRTVNAGDAEAFAANFGAGAVVRDLNREIRGVGAIPSWPRHGIFAVHAPFEVPNVGETQGR